MAGSPQHATLVASTVTTLTFDKYYTKAVVQSVDGTAAVYFTFDGTTPSVAGTGSYVLPAAIGSMEIAPIRGAGVLVVKLISSGTPKVSVRGV